MALAQATFAPETSEQFSRALGEAVVRIWGHLPNTLQSRLFEEAVTSHAVEMRGANLTLESHQGPTFSTFWPYLDGPKC
jgi:hypothetical protein